LQKDEVKNWQSRASRDDAISNKTHRIHHHSHMGKDESQQSDESEGQFHDRYQKTTVLKKFESNFYDALRAFVLLDVILMVSCLYWFDIPAMSDLWVRNRRHV
jgi:hypothetical protein